MGNFFQQINILLLEPPGNLVYHLILTFSVAGALGAALSNGRSGGSLENRRTVLGLGVILFLRLALFVLGALAWQGLLNQHVLMPVLDRAVNLLSLVIIAWMWVFPRPSRSGDAATLLLGLIVLTLSTLSLVWWSAQGTELSYNGTWPDLAAAMLSVAISTTGALLLVLRRPSGWGYGLGMMGIFLVGDIAYLTFPYTPGDHSGIVRLSQVIAYPMLLLLPSRFPATLSAPESGEAKSESGDRVAGDEKAKPLNGWYPSLFSLSLETDSVNTYQAITKAISQEWTADLTLLLSPAGLHGNMKILCGYDLIREQSLAGISINSQSIPVIASAMRRGRSLRLPANSTSPDLAGLEQVLEIQHVGHLLAAPILDPQGNQLAGVILLTPYTKRSWTAEDQLRLSEYAVPLAQLLQHAQQVNSIRTDLDETRGELMTARTELEKAQQENTMLISRLGSGQAADTSTMAQAAGLAALLSAQAANRETVGENVGSQGEENEAGYAEGELRLALEEVARLKMMLFEADKKTLLLRKSFSSASPVGARVAEIVSLAQGLRQPMTSIVGYTDFLLGESVGILGTLQRRFLERIRSSADQINHQVDDLLAIADVDHLESRGAVEVFDLGSVIDDAVTRTGDELRERSIGLSLILPKQMPVLAMDRQALEDLLVVLIQNAGYVTPQDGEISLQVHLKNDQDPFDYTLIQVTDQGGGITPDDLARLFTGGELPPPEAIAGVSARTQKLAVARDMAESLGGRLWVESEPGKGATFSLLFPIPVEEPVGTGGTGK
jgi:signal transduction histidine kinase